MKTRILAILVLAALIYAGHKIFLKKDMSGYGYAAEWGCYQGARRACEHFQTEQEIYACEEDALVFCPEAGKAFKKFMEQNKK